jgi:hypothetical protein
LHIARFEYFPKYGATTKERELALKRVGRDHSIGVIARDRDHFSLTASGTWFDVSLFIDMAEGWFDIEGENEQHGITNVFPERYPRRPGLFLNYANEHWHEIEVEPAAASKVISAAGTIWLAVVRSFDAAVLSGEAKISGRVGSITSPLEPIPPDIWTEMRLDESCNGASIGTVAVYSLQVTPSEGAETTFISPQRAGPAKRGRPRKLEKLAEALRPWAGELSALGHKKAEKLLREHPEWVAGFGQGTFSAAKKLLLDRTKNQK